MPAPTELRALPPTSAEAEALREVGQTAVRPAVAWLLIVIFLATIALVPILEPLEQARDAGGEGGVDLAAVWRGLAESGSAALELGAEGQWLAANRRLLAAVEDLETRLEEDSWLRHRLLPATQALASARLGLGNEQAYVGRDGWLFYRPDVDHVTGPGFLSDDDVRLRPDPRTALLDFQRQLSRRGIRLLLLPTPVKPSLEADHFSRRHAVAGGAPIQNPSFPALLAALRQGGATVLDPSPLLADAKARQGDPQYLRTDTHWTPAAVDLVAFELARRVDAMAALPERSPAGFVRREAIVDGRGDIAAMLRLPAGSSLYPPQRVTIQRVVGWDAGPLPPAASPEILLLGDSFSNVFSDPALGWGSGAGLAEQLAYHLQRPVAKIALNAGGPSATRQAFSRQLAADGSRFAALKIVVYQFATRELTFGDWQTVSLP
jgi:alginate O-acetyltransferase complex protein AlgJ